MTVLSKDLERITQQELAALGGPMAVPDSEQHKNLFRWPIITAEDEEAVLHVLRHENMSGTNITVQFERQWATYNQRRFALSYPNGTMALQAAMWAAGLRRGDEMICPSITYWASALQALTLGATVVFADIDPVSLCIDPGDIQRHISARTKAIMVVHYCGHPCDMDPILRIAEKHGLVVIEDVSHAHGALYKGRLTGTFGRVAAMSMMSGKSFPIGEGGMLVTDDKETYERAIAFSHYVRCKDMLTLDSLRRETGCQWPTALPLGAVKGRLNQLAAALGQVQLKYFPQRIQEIQRAMNRFWDLLEGTPGIRPHRPPKDSGSTMGGWYNPLGHYVPEQLGGLPVEKFIAALQAEGIHVWRGVNFPLHLHPVLNDADIYGDGKPTRIAFSDRDLRQPAGSLPVAEGLAKRALGVPWFKHDHPQLIERYAAAFRKVALQADKLANWQPQQVPTRS